MAEYLDKNGLEDVASKVNSRLKTVTTMPESASDGAVRLYVGASDQTYIKGHVYQYSQSGSEWIDITPAGGSSDYEQLQNLPSINGKVLVGNADGKTYSLVNRNELPEDIEQSTSFPTSYTIHSFCVFNDVLYVGTDGHGIYTSTDGSTFTQNTSFPTSYTIHSFCVFNDVLYVGTDGHGIYTSTDGSTFSQNTSFPTSYTVQVLAVFNNILCIGTYKHSLYTTTDGSTFTQTASFYSGSSIAALCVFNNKLYLASDAGFFSSTNGSAFVPYTSSLFQITISSLVVFKNTLYLAFNGGGLSTSTDGITFTSPIHPTWHTIKPLGVYNDILYAYSNVDGLYTSTDGSTFTQNTSFPTSYTIHSFCVFNDVLYVGTDGHGIYTIDFKLAYDDVPTENSKALMTSGAIQNTLAKLNWDVLPPRFLRFDFNSDDKKHLIIKGGTTIRVGSNLFHVDLDTSYMMSDLMQGKDYFVYLNYSGGEWSVTYEQGTKLADTSTSRCIGRFHTLCASVPAGTTMILPDSPGSGRSAGDNILVKSYRQDSAPDFYAFYNKTISSVESGTYYDVVTCVHPLAGFSAGDILPESVWCLNWKPDTLHEDAMVYDKDTGIAVDVYLQSGTGLNTKSVYEAAHTVSRQQWNHQGDMLAVGKKLLRDYEFSSAALGSNECTSIAGSADAGTVGGHSDSNNRRMISAIGCEEMCGYLWQWLDEVNGKPDENTWTVTDGQGAFGQEFWQPRALLAGGGWRDGTSCGSRCRDAADGRAAVDASIGGRGSSRVVRGA